MFSGPDKVVTLLRRQAGAPMHLINEVEAYWHGLRQGPTLPARAQIDPRGLSRALPNVFILERIAPHVVRFRLSGQALAPLLGMDLRGMPLSALLTPDARAEMEPHIAALFDTPMALRFSLSAEWGIGKPGLSAEMILLPLLGDDGQVSRALGCLVTKGRIGHAPRRFRITGLNARPIATPTANAARPESTPERTRPDASRPALYLVKS